MSGKLSVKEKVSYGLGDMASHIGLDNVIIFLTFYYTDVVGLPAVFVGTMFLVARVADAIVDPAMGLIADRTQTRFGKFRPYILWLALPFGASCLLVYAVPESLTLGGKMVYASVTYCVMMLMYTAINIPYCSMGAIITPDNTQRISLQSYRFFLATLGGAHSLYLDDRIGNFLPGKEADLVVLDPQATPLLARRMASCAKLSERLFVMMMLGDERMVAATHVMGEVAWRRPLRR